jgi:hypothetical protein
VGWDRKVATVAERQGGEPGRHAEQAGEVALLGESVEQREERGEQAHAHAVERNA